MSPLFYIRVRVPCPVPACVAPRPPPVALAVRERACPAVCGGSLELARGALKKEILQPHERPGPRTMLWPN